MKKLIFWLVAIFIGLPVLFVFSIFGELVAFIDKNLVRILHKIEYWAYSEQIEKELNDKVKKSFQNR